MLKSQLNTILYSKNIIASILIGSTLLATVFYIQNLEKNKIIQNQECLIVNLEEKIDVLEKEIETNNLENLLLINDYQLIDSMLYETNFRNLSLVDESVVLAQKNEILKVKKVNSELKSKIAVLLNEVSDLQKQNNSSKITQSLEKLSVDESNIDNKVVPVFNVDKIRFSAFASYSSYKSEKKTKRAKRARKINLCIDLSDFNHHYFADNQDLYLRIANPNGKILAAEYPINDTFNFDGHKISYSLKFKCDSTNQNSKFCVFYSTNTNLIPGVYWIDVFIENQKIGETSFELY